MNQPIFVTVSTDPAYYPPNMDINLDFDGDFIIIAEDGTIARFEAEALSRKETVRTSRLYH